MSCLTEHRTPNTMRYYILKTLVKKEFARHLANRGGIALALLLVASAVLLSVFAPSEAVGGGAGTSMVGGVHHCFVEYDRKTPLIEHLEKNKPTDLKLVFRPLAKADMINSVLVYPTGTASLQIRQSNAPGTRPTVHVYVWHPEGAPAGWRHMSIGCGRRADAHSPSKRRSDRPVRQFPPIRLSTKKISGWFSKRISGFKIRWNPGVGATRADNRSCRIWPSSDAGLAVRYSISGPRLRPAWLCSRCTSLACICCRR